MQKGLCYMLAISSHHMKAGEFFKMKKKFYVGSYCNVLACMDRYIIPDST